jgi:hypothetical protein
MSIGGFLVKNGEEALVPEGLVSDRLVKSGAIKIISDTEEPTVHVMEKSELVDLIVEAIKDDPDQFSEKDFMADGRLRVSALVDAFGDQVTSEIRDSVWEYVGSMYEESEDDTDD